MTSRSNDSGETAPAAPPAQEHESAKGENPARPSARKPRRRPAEAEGLPATPPDGAKGPAVVGIGASAGGLEALELLFANMPADTGMAFVVITHQHPGHTSLLPELLARITELPVAMGNDDMLVEANHVYVCPPGGQLDILDGRLHRTDAEKPEPPHLPIDHFFRSLAADQHEKAICIVLSGTGTDGTLGLKAIKGESGMAMVQQVQSAKYAGMPSSAIATGQADYVLPPEAMPAQLFDYARGPYLAAPRARNPPEVPDEPLQKIYLLLRSRTGHDFSGYKGSTIRRRIERRMNVHQIHGPGHYVRFLQENPHELDILFKELLISVTNFFRDPEAFAALAAALPELLASRADYDTLRVWAPGCATGEEVYSIAIVLKELIEERKRPIDVQLFGTDLDAEGVETARAGRYPEGIAVDVAPGRLDRYFVHEDGGYRIRKDVRDMAIFAVQNVIKDPPFTKLDLLICRNLLIYLNGDLQKKLLPLFHYALKPGGLLFLGPSESIGGFSELFEVIDKKWNIFRRKEFTAGVSHAVHFPTDGVKSPVAGQLAVPAPRPLEPVTANIAAAVERLLLTRFAPASVVVNEHGDVVFIYGRTGEYLEPAPGQPRVNVLDMAREGLQIELSAALRQASRQSAEVRQENVRVRTNGHFTCIDLTVARIAMPEALHGLFLVTFHPRAQPVAKPGEQGERRKSAAPERMATLERQLKFTKESLQSTIEELETSNEELKSTNEELQSTNEELQSTNEELETSKEEMQSLNEELTTVNAELHAKVEELSRINDDMQNLLNSTEIATIFLDRQLNISRYTEQTLRLVNLIQTDVGRPLADLVSHIDYDQLVPDCREVLRSLVFKQAEVQTRDGRWFFMRIMPYRTAAEVIDGLVLTFVDINPVKRAEEELAATRDRVDADLQAMTRLQEIASLFIRGYALSTILDEVLEAAMSMSRADMGTVQLADAADGKLRIVAQRGFKKAVLDHWEHGDDGSGAFGAPLVDGGQVLVRDIDQSAEMAGSPLLEVLSKAGVCAVHSTPLMTHDGRFLGVISTHFRKPYQPDEHALRFLDLLVRQTRDMLEHAAAAPGERPT